MSYEAGNATDGTDLLQKLVTWLVSIGWNSDLSASDQANGGWRAHLDKSGLFVHLRSHFPGDTSWAQSATTAGYALQLYLSTAFDGGQQWNSQPGNPPLANGSSTQVIGAGAHLTAGPFSNYYFFSDTSGDHIVVVVEISPGLYVHFGWGPSLVKNGTISATTAYFFASSSGYYASDSFSSSPGWTLTSRCPGAHEDIQDCATGFMLCDSDSFTGKWIGITDQTFAAGGYTGRTAASMVYADVAMTSSIPRYSNVPRTTVPPYFQFGQTSEQDGRANLLPVVWWVGRDGSSGQTGGFSPVGSIPTVFFSNGVGNGFASAEDYVIGSDTYTMFPEFAVKKVV